MATNNKAYMREYSRRRRLGKIEEPRPQLPRKKDIFEVAAQLERALKAANDRAVPRFGYNNAQTLEALAAYREYWEEND